HHGDAAGLFGDGDLVTAGANLQRPEPAGRGKADLERLSVQADMLASAAAPDFDRVRAASDLDRQLHTSRPCRKPSRPAARAHAAARTGPPADAGRGRLAYTAAATAATSSSDTSGTENGSPCRSCNTSSR